MALFSSRLSPAGRGTNRRRRFLASFLLIIAAVAAGVTASSSDRVNDLIAPPATVSIATPQARTAEEQAYLDAILPLTEELVGEGRMLSELGTARSRNILELRTRSRRFRQAAEAIVRTEQGIRVPDRLAPFSESLNAGIADALVAVEQAESAVLGLNWEEVQTAVTSFTTAIDVIASAIDHVEQS